MLRRLTLAILILTSVAAAALTTVTDTVNRADGTPAAGYLNISWQAFRNAAGTLIPAGNIRNVPLVSGVFTVNLEPNIGASPTGTSYVVTYVLNGSQNTQWRWYVPASNTPVGLNGVQFPTPGLIGNSASVNPSQLLQAGASLNQALCWNGAYWAPGSCGGGGGAPAFNTITSGTNTIATMTAGSGAGVTYSGSGYINANRIIGTSITSIVGNSGGLLETTGGLTSGRLLSADASSNATDSGVVAANVIVNTGSYANPAWITALAASKLTGTVACAQLPALTGDATTVANTCATTVSSTNGLAFAASATINALNAANISSGTLPAARLPAINLAASGAGGVTGNLPVTNLNGGSGASSTTAWFGDSTWKSIAAGGTVTNTSGALVAGNLIIGNSGNDVTILGTLGTSVQVLHGNAGGNPSWGAVSLTADITGTLATANGGLGSTSIAFTGPSGAVKSFALPNASTTILTTNAAVTLAQGGTGADLSAVAKGGLFVGTAAATLGIKAVGTDGQVLMADAASAGGVKWSAVAGTGTVTSIATTSPITGGTITTTGTIACATCVTSAAALTASRLVLGGGSQATAVLGSLGTTTTVLHGNSGGDPSFAAVSLTADVSGVLPIANGGTNASTATGASGQLQVQRSETGAVSRTYAAKFGETLTAEDFGCAGDGTTDDTTCLQNALTAVQGTTKTLILGQSYKVTGCPSVSGSVRVTGGGTIKVSPGVGVVGCGLKILGAVTATVATTTTNLTLAGRFTAATPTIGFSSVTGFAVGDVVNLDYDDGTYHFEQNTVIKQISGLNVTLSDPVSIPLLTSATNNITKLTMVQGANVHDLKFDCTGASASAAEVYGLLAFYVRDSDFSDLTFTGCTGTTASALYAYEGHLNTFSNIRSWNSGSGGIDSIRFAQQTRPSATNITATSTVTATAEFGIGVTYCVLGQFANMSSSGHSGRQIKLLGAAWNNITNVTANNSAGATGLSITLASYRNIINGVQALGSVVGTSNGVGVWFSGQDNGWNTITGLNAFGNTTGGDINFGAPSDHDNVIYGAAGTVLPNTDVGNNMLFLTNAIQAVAQFSCTGTVAAGTVIYPTRGSAACTNTSETTAQWIVMPYAGYLRNLRVKAQTGGVNASSGVVTIITPGIGGYGITCTLGTGTTCSDLRNQYFVSAGTLLEISVTTQALETLANLSISFEY